jgi:glycosyltransferase involved in cell wall biosynthesis
MTIHFYTFSDARGGSSRQRVFRVVEELSKRGVKTEIHLPPVLDISRTPWPRKGKAILHTIVGLRTIAKGDIVYLHRTIANKYFFLIMVAYLKITRRKMIFDMDDPFYVHSFLKTKIFIQMADFVITCTHAQADWARQYNKNVTVIHIALSMSDYERYTKVYAENESPVVIGWIGSGPEHIRNLALMVPIFTYLAKKHPHAFRFVLVGALSDKNVYRLFDTIAGLRVDFIDSLDWKNPESTPIEIQKFDIGIVPHLREGEWNRAKSSFKVLEYMACGVATVASAFGEMPYIITDGENGFLAASEKEWIDSLERLITDPSFRTTLGKAGQKRIREAYCFDATIPQYMEVIRSVNQPNSFD